MKDLLKGCALIFVALCVFGLVYNGISDTTPTPETEEYVEGQNYDVALVCAQNEMASKVNSSKVSHEFGAQATHLSGERYSIISYLEYQNQFGGWGRLDYSCIAEVNDRDTFDCSMQCQYE